MEDGMPNSTIALTFDFDALSVWFSYPNTTPAMLARGEYGARVGVPRVLDLLRDHGIAATFFIPGHTLDSFPEQVATILDAGHEVAHHSYAHVDPSTQTPDAERRDLERGVRLDARPRGRWCADRGDAPTSDRAWSSDRDARAVHRPLPSA